MECPYCGAGAHNNQHWCGECGKWLLHPQKDDIKDPQHYAGKYPFEVYQAIKLILNEFASDLSPYEIYQLGNELKYRLRAGWKDDGEQGFKDLRKAVRCNEMRAESTQMVFKF